MGALQRIGLAFGMLPAVVLLGATARAAESAATAPPPYVADGRATLDDLYGLFDTLLPTGRWTAENIYTYPDDTRLRIRAWRTQQQGPALWLLAGIHGEEPAGPNALALQIDSIAVLARAGVPLVMLPLCNPRAYWNNWRYPATADRDWKGAGYSVGDSEWLLPKVAGGEGPRAAEAPGPETAALTGTVLRLARQYPPVLVLDFHEDELSPEGGYVYWQGRSGAGPRVAREIVRLLRSADVPIRMSGSTRFGETIEGGIIRPNGVGQLFNDGSIDELLAAPRVIVDGKPRPGPGAPVSIVIETPAPPGSMLAQRVAGHRAVIARIEELWLMSDEAEP